MTSQNQIIDDPKYIPVLDHGFVGLVDHMGSDSAIVQAARVSYGAGTKKVSEDRGLIRYLIRNKHTSPVEMAVVKLHLKLPIFVMRQLVRHRTASLNEYSGRYSVMTDEFYIPDQEIIMPQSKDNKQGRAGMISDEHKKEIVELITGVTERSYSAYEILMNEREDQEYPGMARELSRIILPVNNYTELYWCQNLHNMLHLLRLRMDSHAQYEIRVIANAIYDTIKPLFPHTIEAWEDYVLNAKTFSSMDIELMKKIFGPYSKSDIAERVHDFISDYPSDKEFYEEWKLSKREVEEFINKF